MLVEQLSAPSRTSMLRNSTWTISNLCRGATNPDPNALQPLCRGATLAARRYSPAPSHRPPATRALATPTLGPCRAAAGKPPPRWGLVAQALPLLQTLTFSTDEEVLL